MENKKKFSQRVRKVGNQTVKLIYEDLTEYTYKILQESDKYPFLAKEAEGQPHVRNTVVRNIQTIIY